MGSPAGLFVLEADTDRFYPVAHEVPFWGINAIGLAHDSLLVAGLPHGLIRSSDGGRHWLQSTITQTVKPITCLAASPNVAHDGVVLAGTAGDGVLRSIDGGRYWELVNFGLRDFDVLGMACAPAWGRREIAVAATTQGLYQSPNGGRAWRQATMPAQVAPQTVCFSLDFADDQTVFAGTEENGLLVSYNQGLNWQKDGRFPQNQSITWLGAQAGLLVAATGDGQLYTSADNGCSWQGEPISSHPILAVATAGKQRWVGLAEAGLFTNAARAPWVPVQSVAAQRFSHLTAGEGAWLASGPLAGVFGSQDAGHSWQRLVTAHPGAQIQAIAQQGKSVGFIQSGQLIWAGKPVARVNRASCLATDGLHAEEFEAAVYAGTQTGQLWRKMGLEWKQQAVPWHQTPVLALACHGQEIVAIVQDRRSAAVSAGSRQAVGVFYRSHPAAEWQVLGSQNSYGHLPRVALIGGKSPRIALGMGGICWLGVAGKWSPHKVGSAAAPITSIVADRENGRFLCTTFDGLHVYENERWQATPAPNNTIIVDVFCQEQEIVLLTLEGRLLRRS